MIIDNNKEIKSALSNSEHTILVRGKLAKRLRLISNIRNKGVNLNSGMTTRLAAAKISALSGLSIAVAITLILTMGSVLIMAILKDYNIKIPGYGVILERTN